MLYYNASCRVSLKDRQTRQFFMERNTTSVMSTLAFEQLPKSDSSDDGARPAIENMARFPATPTPSEPATPQGSHGRRKIRCKMCRRHLAVREHMMDHILDQSPISRPRTPSASFNLPSPTVNTTAEPAFRSRVPSVSEIINPLTGMPGATVRERTLSMSSADVPMPRASAPGLALTSTSSEINKPERTSSPAPISPRRTSSPAHLNAEQLASRLPPHLLALRSASVPGSNHSSPFASSPPNGSPQVSQPASPDSAKDPHASLAQQQSAPAPGSGAAIAGRRLSMLALTPNDASNFAGGISPMSSGPPILVNPKCSGYFVEPVRFVSH
jgi:dual specificity phosphatase 12